MSDLEETLQVVIDELGAGIYKLTGEISALADNNFGTISDSINAIAGYSSRDFSSDSASWRKLLHAEDIIAVQRETERIISSKKPGTRYYRIRHKGTGDYRWIEDRIVPKFDEAGRLVAIYGSARDISDRKEFELELNRLSRLEAIGHVAGEVAHDFINLLSVIKGYASYPPAKRGCSKEVMESLKQIDRTASRAVSLMRRLSLFGTRSSAKTQVANLNELIRKKSPLWARILGKNIPLRASLFPGPAYVEIRRGQFEQILKVLLDNAREAMPNGGKVILQTELLTPHVNDKAGELISREGKKPANLSYVHVSVTDTGVGMDEAVKSRICEPFFSTKTKEKHAGLGLATALAITAYNNGSMRVFSELGRGTSVHLYLPKASPKRSQHLRGRRMQDSSIGKMPR